MDRLSWGDIEYRADTIVNRMRHLSVIRAYPIPRGGIPAALAVKSRWYHCGSEYPFIIVEDPKDATVYIDDIVDSGATRAQYHDKPFFALVDKTDADSELGWVEFPWERMAGEVGPEENIRRLIEYLGDDPKREGLLETPLRVMRSYDELFAGYKQNPQDVIKVFKEGACDEMVVIRNVEFTSVCEHHMLPFVGTAHIAYVPNEKVIGVSKLARLLDIFARRLQIQERICQQVTGALDEFLEPRGSACVLVAKHLCMSSRGVAKQHSEMVTSSLSGVFRDEGNAARSEFFSMIRGV